MNHSRKGKRSLLQWLEGRERKEKIQVAICLRVVNRLAGLVSQQPDSGFFCEENSSDDDVILKEEFRGVIIKQGCLLKQVSGHHSSLLVFSLLPSPFNFYVTKWYLFCLSNTQQENEPRRVKDKKSSGDDQSGIRTGGLGQVEHKIHLEMGETLLLSV